MRAKQRHQQVLIGVYLYTFENSVLEIKILVSNIKSTILKKQKNIGKAERTEKPSKSRIFLLKAEEVAALDYIVKLILSKIFSSIFIFLLKYEFFFFDK